MFKRWFKPRSNRELDELYFPYNRFASMARSLMSNNKVLGRKRPPRIRQVGNTGASSERMHGTTPDFNQPLLEPLSYASEPRRVSISPWLQESVHDQRMTTDSAWYTRDWQVEVPSARRFYEGCEHGSWENVSDSLHEIVNAGMAVAQTYGNVDVHVALHGLLLYLYDRG